MRLNHPSRTRSDFVRNSCRWQGSTRSTTCVSWISHDNTLPIFSNEHRLFIPAKRAACEGPSKAESHKQAWPWGNPCYPQPCLPGPQARRRVAANARWAHSLKVAGRHLEIHLVGWVWFMIDQTHLAVSSDLSCQPTAAEAATRDTHRPGKKHSCCCTLCGVNTPAAHTYW